MTSNSLPQQRLTRRAQGQGAVSEYERTRALRPELIKYLTNTFRPHVFAVVYPNNRNVTDDNIIEVLTILWNTMAPLMSNEPRLAVKPLKDVSRSVRKRHEYENTRLRIEQKARIIEVRRIDFAWFYFLETGPRRGVQHANLLIRLPWLEGQGRSLFFGTEELSKQFESEAVFNIQTVFRRVVRAYQKRSGLPLNEWELHTELIRQTTDEAGLEYARERVASYSSKYLSDVRWGTIPE